LTVVVLAMAVSAPALAVPVPKDKKAATVPPLDKDLENEVWAILERGTRSSDMETRSIAVEYLLKVRPEAARNYLVDALGDPQWIVRRAAIKALITAGDEAYRKTLAAAVANAALYEKMDLNPLPLVLGLPPAEAVQLLEEALTKVPEVRDIILKEIFKKDSPLATQLYDGLRKIPAVKVWVMSNLTIFADKNMYPLLVKTLPEFSKEELLKVFTFLEGLDASYDYSFLPKYLADKDEDIQLAAAYDLALRGDDKAAEYLLPLCDENDVHRQLRCLNGLKGIPRNPDVLERAKLFLYGDPDPEVLYAVYDIFTRAGDDSVYDRMVARLNSTNLGHRAASVYFIGKLKGTRALPQLHELLRDGSSIIRLRAAQAIGELKQAESVPFIADAIRNDADPAVKKALVVALGSIGDRSIVEVVSFLIFDPEVRHDAIVALCGVRHRDAIPTLRNVLQNQFSQEERTMAMRAIVRISPAEGLQVFKGALGWIPEGFLSEMAAEIKGEFIEYLKAALTSINERVTREAVLAFKHLGTDIETKVLERELFNSKDNTLRRLILGRLAEIKLDASNDLLAAFYADTNRELKLTSIQQSGRYLLSTSAAVPALRKLLMDPDETFRVGAAAALVEIFQRPAPLPAAPAKSK
jgi:HEAT repeat protein